MLGTYHLNSLFDILKEIHFIYDPDKLLRYVLEQCCKILQSEAATFFVASEDAEELHVQVAYGVDETRLKQIPFRRGVGICGWCLQYNQPALVTDVSLDNRFNRAIDAVTGIRTRSILAVPVFSQKRPYGVLEMFNRKSGQFGPQDQEFLTVLGRQVAAAFQNLLYVAEIKHARTLLQGIVENLSGGLVTMDLEGKVTTINPAAIRILDVVVPPIGRPVKEVLKECPWFVEILEKTLKEKNTVSRQEVNLTLHGQENRIGYTTLLISDPQKNLLGSGIIFQQLPKL